MGRNQIDNLYAFNNKDVEIFILDAQSGRKGYFCLGCKMEMQAVIAKKPNRKSYFRHDPKGVEGKGKCTYSDETYRHALAKTILQDIKKIKVPPVYKYPPKGEKGFPNLLANSSFINADSVGIEYCFYENDDGSVSFGKSYEPQLKYLLVRPDVTFFDKDKNPILFIELVATHKISEEKLLRIKRLGINTVQVIIPKNSPEAIAGAFTKTNFTKWIYNHEQEYTPYIPVPESNSTGISPIDEIQRLFFEESYSCRATQINNLIRTFRKSLESEHYRSIEQKIKSEISRVEKNTESNRNEWNRIQRARIAEIQDLYSEEISRIEGKGADIERSSNFEISGIESNIQRIREEEKRVGECEKDLDERYQLKKRDVESEIDRIRKSTSLTYETGETIEQAFGKEEHAIRSIEREQRDLDNKIRNFGSEEDQLKNHFGEFKTKAIEDFKKDRSRKIEQIGRIQSDIDSLPGKFDSLGKSKAEGYRNIEETVRGEFNNLYRAVIGEIEKREIGKHGNLSKDIKRFFEAISLLDNICEVYSLRKRNEDALLAIRSGAYKNWYK